MSLLRVSCLLLVLVLTVIAAPVTGLAADSASAEPLELDTVSSGCVSCHNGSDGPHAGFCLLAQKGQGDGHVVSAVYAGLAERNKDLRPADTLPGELVLFEGKITCVTCHGNDPHDGRITTIDNSGSALCRACHLK